MQTGPADLLSWEQAAAAAAAAVAVAAVVMVTEEGKKGKTFRICLSPETEVFTEYRTRILA